MSATTTKPTQDEWISAAQAEREFGLTRIRIYRLTVGKQIRVRLPRGVPPRYSRADLVRALATEAGEGR